uniref:Uncharacterized protein n=1 Tax=Strongyloides venezuelensis TaxID=75913 RepID=A0A0K0FRS0_STRVS
MSYDLFKIYHQLVNAININSLIASNQNNTKYINFGIINKENSLLKIYLSYSDSSFINIKIQVPEGAVFPSLRTSHWKELLIDYRGEAISGVLPPKLKFLALRGFNHSINIS